MQTTVRYIIVTGISFGCISMLYFLSLVLHVPFFIALPVIIAGIFFLTRWLIVGVANPQTNITQYPVIAFLVLAAAIVLMIQKSYEAAYKYGGWDAWCFWNLHARFMAGGVATWKNMFLNTFADHADYPLLVPGINGFFMRIFTGNTFITIPFIVCFTVTLFIPVAIYLENLGKNIVIAILVLFLMAQDIFYLSNGVSQYADVVVAFFFLCGVICINHAGADRKNIFLAAACAGCCAWTKNEGAVLAAVFILFYIREFFLRGNIKYFIGGIALPLAVLLIFKIVYSPQNDLVSGQGSDTWKRLLDPARYQLIYSHFSEQMDKNFAFLKIGFFLYLLLCIVEKKGPGRQFFMILTCMTAYTMIYVISPMALEWHLATSLERLMLQLSPVMIYVFSQRFCRVKFYLEKMDE